MATLALQALRHSASLNSGGPELDDVVLTAGQTPQAADLVTRVNGQGVVCGADPTPIGFLCPAPVASAVPGHTTAAGLVIMSMEKIRSTDTYEISAWNATAGTSVVPDSLIDDNAEFGITKATVSGKTEWCLDLSDAVNTRVRLVKRLSEAADEYPRVLVQFLPAHLTNL